MRKEVYWYALLCALGSMAWFGTFLIRDGMCPPKFLAWPAAAVLFSAYCIYEIRRNKADLPPPTPESRRSLQISRVFGALGMLVVGGILFSFFFACWLQIEPASVNFQHWGFSYGLMELLERNKKDIPNTYMLKWDCVAFVAGFLCLVIALITRLYAHALAARAAAPKLEAPPDDQPQRDNA